MKKKSAPSIQLGLEHHQAGRLAQARAIYSSILEASPNHSQALYLLGLIAQQSGEHEKAVQLFFKASELNPSQALIYLQMGISLNHLGRAGDAVSSYRRALVLNPSYVEAHSNLGNVLKSVGDLDGAIASYHRALQLAPDAAQIHYNVGVLFQEQFQPEKAIECFRNAIHHKADYAAAYNNLGVSLGETGRLDEAIVCYKKAQELDPSFADSFYNLHALLLDSDDMSGSIACMERAKKLQPKNYNYRFFLGMLHDYTGDPEKAKHYFCSSKIESDLFKADLDAWRYLKAFQPAPLMTGSGARTFTLAIDNAKVQGLVLEFGVFHGKSIRQIASLVDGTVHGFDSFQGLPEDWHHEPTGSYSTKGVLPDVPDNVILHAGWFEDSIPAFIEKQKGPIRFMNIDCDLYSSTKTVLELLAAQVVSGTVIVFDEFIGNLSWRDDEFKAFNETAEKHSWSYELLSFSFVTKQVAIRIT